MNSGRFIVVDWGTTNRRAPVDDGAAIDTICDDKGAASLAAGDYPAEVNCAPLRTLTNIGLI